MSIPVSANDGPTTSPPALPRVDTRGGNQIDPGHDYDARAIGGSLDDLRVSGGLRNASVPHLHQHIGGLECFRQKACGLCNVAGVPAHTLCVNMLTVR